MLIRGKNHINLLVAAQAETLISIAILYTCMGENFPSPKETHNNHFPDKRFSISVRYRTNDGHDSDNFIGGIPKNTPYMLISLSNGSWNSKTWGRLEESFENEGFETHLRKTSGTTRTRSGTCKHAPTSMYVWRKR